MAKNIRKKHIPCLYTRVAKVVKSESERQRQNEACRGAERDKVEGGMERQRLTQRLG